MVDDVSRRGVLLAGGAALSGGYRDETGSPFGGCQRSPRRGAAGTDGGRVFVGELTERPGEDDAKTRPALVHTNEEGAVVWERSYDPPYDPFLPSGVVPDADGHFHVDTGTDALPDTERHARRDRAADRCRDSDGTLAARGNDGFDPTAGVGRDGRHHSGAGERVDRRRGRSGFGIGATLAALGGSALPARLRGASTDGE